MVIRVLATAALILIVAGELCPSSFGTQAGTSQSIPASKENPSQQQETQHPTIPANTQAPPNESKSNGRGYQKTLLSDYEFWLSLEILLFGLGVVTVEYLMLRKGAVTAEEALRVFAVTLIIIGTLFAITAGFDSNQIAPAMGLFGTIAGYLLGRRATTGTPESPALGPPGTPTPGAPKSPTL